MIFGSTDEVVVTTWNVSVLSFVGRCTRTLAAPDVVEVTEMVDVILVMLLVVDQVNEMVNVGLLLVGFHPMSSYQTSSVEVVILNWGVTPSVPIRMVIDAVPTSPSSSAISSLLACRRSPAVAAAPAPAHAVRLIAAPI
jgi:hypothetical protein